MSKRNLNTAATSANIIITPVRKTNPAVLLAPVRKANPVNTMFAQPVKMESDEELHAYMALTGLKLGHGNAQTVCELLARLFVGRLAALLYFDERSAFKMHSIIQDYYAWMRPLDDNSTTMKVGQTLAAKLAEGLELTRTLRLRLTKYELQNVVFTYMKIAEIQLNSAEHDFVETCSWAEYQDFYNLSPANKAQFGNLLVEAVD